MKLRIIFFITLVICWLTTIAQHPWQSVNTFRIDKVQPHANIIPYSNKAQTAGLQYTLSEYYQEFTSWREQSKDSLATQYSHTLQIPTSWNNRRTFLCIEQFHSAIMVYVNGRKVGYSEDGHSPAEFDITKYLDTLGNRIVIKVFNHSTGDSLECDTADFLGKTFLYSTPWRYISDYKITTTLDTTTYTKGTLEVDVELSSEVPKDMRISLDLSYHDTLVLHKSKKIQRGNWFLFFLPKELPLKQIHTWDSEHPNLYTLRIQLYNAEDSLIQIVATEIGFRTVELCGNELKINGKTDTLKGVDLEGDVSLQELEIMHNLGINLIRTTQAPYNETFYHHCNRLGIYVWDIANNHDCHSSNIASNKQFTDAMLYRCNNLYKRNRNHPSVIIWSSSTLEEQGFNTWESSRFLQGKDNTRPVLSIKNTPHNYEDLGILNFRLY